MYQSLKVCLKLIPVFLFVLATVAFTSPCSCGCGKGHKVGFSSLKEKVGKEFSSLKKFEEKCRRNR